MSDPARVELVEVVWVSFDRVGPGDEPARSVNQYWSKDGRLLVEFDHAFHAADVPAYEVARLRAQVTQQESGGSLQVLKAQCLEAQAESLMFQAAALREAAGRGAAQAQEVAHG